MASWDKSVAERGAMERQEVSVDDLISELSAHDEAQNKQMVCKTDSDYPAYCRLWLMKGKNAEGQNATFSAVNADIGNEETFQVAVLDDNEELNYLTNKQNNRSFYGHWLHKSQGHDNFEGRSFVSYITIPREFLHFNGINWNHATSNIICRSPSDREKIIDYFKEQLDKHCPRLQKFFEEEFIFKQCERRGLPTSLVDMISTTPKIGTLGGIGRANNREWHNIYKKVTSENNLWPAIKETFDKVHFRRDKHHYAFFAGRGMYEALVGTSSTSAVHDEGIQHAWALDCMDKGDSNVDGDPTNHLYIVNTRCIGYKEADFNPMQIYIEPSIFGFRIGKCWSHLAYAERLDNSALIHYCPDEN